MNHKAYHEKAFTYLTALCGVKPNRRTGSPGNREATEFFAGVVGNFGYQLDTRSFPCLDYVTGVTLLTSGIDSYEIFISPYSMGCDITAGVVVVDSIEALVNSDCQGKILLMKETICSEQLMPKNFVFYNPEHHQKIYALLEEKNPAGIITATSKNPDLVGALYPFPLIVDGDFDIPNVYCSDIVGDEISKNVGEVFHLFIEAKRIHATACNVIARKNPESKAKIVLTAHIDAYENTPGASDNASGTVVLMLLAEMLSDYSGPMGIEISAFNGEDHYSVAGQMDYLKRYGSNLDQIVVIINIDDVGYKAGRAAYSFYSCPPDIQQKAFSVFKEFPGIVQGEPWYNGDHMIFVQKGVSSIAFTAEMVLELMATITHTPQDTPDLVDPAKLVEVARALERFVYNRPKRNEL